MYILEFEEQEYRGIASHIQEIEQYEDMQSVDLRRLQEVQKYIAAKLVSESTPQNYIWRWEYTNRHLKKLIDSII